MHRPKAVLQRHAAHCSIVHRCKVHASAVHELCAKGKPLGRIMVAGNKTYAAALSGQHSQKLIQQRPASAGGTPCRTHLRQSARHPLPHVLQWQQFDRGCRPDLPRVKRHTGAFPNADRTNAAISLPSHSLFVVMHLIIADFLPEEQKKLFPPRRPLQAKAPLL